MLGTNLFWFFLHMLFCCDFLYAFLICIFYFSSFLGPFSFFLSFISFFANSIVHIFCSHPHLCPEMWGARTSTNRFFGLLFVSLDSTKPVVILLSLAVTSWFICVAEVPYSELNRSTFSLYGAFVFSHIGSLNLFRLKFKEQWITEVTFCWPVGYSLWRWLQK